LKTAFGLMVAVLGSIALVSGPADAKSSTMAITWGHGNSTAVRIAGPQPGSTAVQAANWGGMVLDASGFVWTWNDSRTPQATKVNGPTKVVSVGEGDNTTAPYGLAVTGSGKLWSWGHDRLGQLCNGTLSGGVEAPELVPGLNDAVRVSGGSDHVTILTTKGTVESCGGNRYGQLGDGSTTASDRPVQVAGLKDITQVSAGSNTSDAVDSSGNVWDWGENNFGQLGDGTTKNSDVPVKVLLPGPAVQVYGGGGAKTNGQSIALLRNGQVWAWGSDGSGQLGDGKDDTFSDVPVRVKGLPAVSYVVTGGATSYALSDSGDVWAWGSDVSGAVGDGNASKEPVLKPEDVGSGYSEISATAQVFMGLRSG
jgi:Regulator of chromosome condensation (RCC1) repeat